MFGHSIKDWIWASRPWSYPASAMPVLVTIAFLFWESRVEPLTCNWLNGWLAVVSMMLFQGAANLISDYFDFHRGVDRSDTFGSRVLISGRFAPKEVLIYGLVMLGTAVSVGLWILYRTGDWRLIPLGLTGAFFVLCYSFFKFRALGDAVIFLDFSVLPILGTTLVITGSFKPEALILAIPIGLITVAILHVNNWRDIATDGRAKIHTFSMLIGSKASQWVYVFELLFPFLWIIGAILIGNRIPGWTLLSLCALPFALTNVRQAIYRTDDTVAIANLDERTAQFQLLFSTLLAISFVVTTLV